jgi:hypothetical protein
MGVAIGGRSSCLALLPAGRERHRAGAVLRVCGAGRQSRTHPPSRWCCGRAADGRQGKGEATAGAVQKGPCLQRASAHAPHRRLAFPVFCVRSWNAEGQVAPCIQKASLLCAHRQQRRRPGPPSASPRATAQRHSWCAAARRTSIAWRKAARRCCCLVLVVVFCIVRVHTVTHAQPAAANPHREQHRSSLRRHHTHLSSARPRRRLHKKRPRARVHEFRNLGDTQRTLLAPSPSFVSECCRTHVASLPFLNGS